MLKAESKEISVSSYTSKSTFVYDVRESSSSKPGGANDDEVTSEPVPREVNKTQEDLNWEEPSPYDEVSGVFTMPDDYLKGESEEEEQILQVCRRIVRECCYPDPDKRPSAKKGLRWLDAVASKYRLGEYAIEDKKSEDKDK